MITKAQITRLASQEGVPAREDVTVRVYTLLEIAGEKLRCVLERLQCRDLFDLHVLFEEAQIDPAGTASIYRAKAEHHQLDPESFAKRYHDRIAHYRKRWETELREHIPGELPHFDRIERQLARHLRRAVLL